MTNQKPYIRYLFATLICGMLAGYRIQEFPELLYQGIWTAMDFDLPGRIKNTKLPVSGALLPIFEAVVNSIQAVDEAPHPENGVIRVHLERDLAQQSFPSEVVGVVLGPVRSVTIRDNGIGFTDVHYKSFCTADTRQKASIGGKGCSKSRQATSSFCIRINYRGTW